MDGSCSCNRDFGGVVQLLVLLLLTMFILASIDRVALLTMHMESEVSASSSGRASCSRLPDFVGCVYEANLREKVE